jgi:hypothetical protein
MKTSNSIEHRVEKIENFVIEATYQTGRPKNFVIYIVYYPQRRPVFP